MVNIAAPKKRKEQPPSEASVNLTKASDKNLVSVNFRVPAEFHKSLKQYAIELNLTMTELVIRAVDEYRQRH